MNLKTLMITAACATVSLPALAAHGPRTQFPAPRAVASIPAAAQAKVLHAAGPRMTLLIRQNDEPAQLAAAVSIESYVSHRAGPRQTLRP